MCVHSGLDPAGPWFDTEDTRVRLDSSDAQFMDNTHTGADGFIHLGLGYPVGHADFFPNLGYDQPPCANASNPIGWYMIWGVFIWVMLQS